MLDSLFAAGGVHAGMSVNELVPGLADKYSGSKLRTTALQRLFGAHSEGTEV